MNIGLELLHVLGLRDRRNWGNEFHTGMTLAGKPFRTLLRLLNGRPSDRVKGWDFERADDRRVGWQKCLQWAVVGETMQFVEEDETRYCAAVLKGG